MDIKQNIDALMLAGGLILAGAGAYDLTIPREYGLNKIEQAAIAIDTPQAVEYGRKTMPGTIAFWSGAGLLLGAYIFERERNSKELEDLINTDNISGTPDFSAIVRSVEGSLKK